MSLRAFATAASIAAALAAATPASAREPATLPDVEDEVMCPICGTPLEHSQAPQAERQRALIRELIASGATKEEVKDALVAEYGEAVLAVPGDDGFELTAWVVPPAAILLAGGAIAFFALRRRRSSPEPPALDPGDAQRLERELAEDER